MKLIYSILLSLSIGAAFAQTGKRVLLMNGTAHLGNGRVIENSVIAFKNGRFDLVADAQTVRLDLNAFDTVINISGKHVYPGLIATNSILGLQEAEAVRATNDYNEVGNFTPHVRSLIAYNTDSKILPTVKTNGILYTQPTPRGGTISGNSSVLATDGWNWEDAVLKADDGIHVSFPEAIRKNGWWAEPAANDKNPKYDEQLTALDRFMEDAKAYCAAASNPETNLRFEAMRGVFTGTQNLYLHTDDAKDIIAAIVFAKKHSIKKPVIVGGRDSWKVTKLLRENHIPVMIGRLHALPEQDESNVDIVYRLPYLLHKDSILFCLQNHGDMEAMQSRNLPFLAGTAAAYGLNKEEALQSITLNPAKILGIDSLVGSIEPGKIASFVVSEGDLLDMKSNQVILAFLNGRALTLNNFQKDLYHKYLKKYGLKE